MTVVTISATYGAGGSQISPRVAERLGVPFIDRAVPVAVAHKLGITLEEASAVEANTPGRWWSTLAGLSAISSGIPIPASGQVDERQLIAHTEEEIRRAAATGSGVILGRAAAVVLADDPNVFHVRLDGDADGRVRAAMHQHGIDRETATAAQKENDRVRSGYVKHYYRVDAAHADLYHMVIDTVRLKWSAVEEIILSAVQHAGVTAVGAPSAPTAQDESA